MNRLRRLLARRAEGDDLAREIKAHLEEQTQELVDRGMDPAEAARAARRRFGNLTQIRERSHAVWGWPSVESLVMDVRYALRQLRRAPGLATAAIGTLAIGIAANATVFSWTRAVLLDPLPGADDPSRVVAIEGVTPSGEWTPTSYQDFRDLRDNSPSLTSATVAYSTRLAIGDGDQSEFRWGELVSGSFFDLLRLRPLVGRFFTDSEQDDAAGAHPVAVISHSLWVSRYRADTAIIGSKLTVNRYPLTIVGVAPPSFHGSMPGNHFEIWVPATTISLLDPNGAMFLNDRKTRMFRVLARLADGVSPAAAGQALEALALRMAEANPTTNQGMSAAVLPLWRSHFGVHNGLRAPLLVLTAASGLVLLVVCANLANLLLARAAGRRREFGLRLSLGAPRSRLVRQVLTEATVLTVAGSVLGLLGAVWLSGTLRSMLPAFGAPTLVSPRVDGGVVAFTGALAGVVALLVGIAPALAGAREHLAETLSEAGRSGGGGRRSQRLRSLLVVGETALATMALVGAGFFLRSFTLTRSVDPGFQATGVAIGQVSLAAAGYDGRQGDAFCRAVRERLERIPGVTAVSYADYVPLSVSAGSWEDLHVEGYSPEPNENMKLYRDVVAPGYFDVLRIPIREGRDFTLQDDVSHDPVMIVNAEFVRHFLDGRAALGRRVRGWGRWFTIVGVVEDTKVYRLTERPTPYFYVPMRQVYRPEFAFTFMVRTTGSVIDAAAAVRREAAAVDPGVVMFNTMALTDYIAAPLDQERTAASLLGILAGVALILAAIGLYGVMAYSVAQRTQEIGIRLALGARPVTVMAMVLGQASGLLAIGLGLGLFGAAGVVRLVESMLYGVRLGQPTVYLAAAAVMATITLVAAGLPARRAMGVDPMTALRPE